MLVKCLLHQIAKEWNLEEQQTFDDSDPYQSVYVLGYQCLTNTPVTVCHANDVVQWYQCLTNTLWTMCHANDATTDVDRFF